MQIYVGKNGQQLGPFTLDEVNRKLADGAFSGSDLAWYEGAAGWAPLSGVPGVLIHPAHPATPPATPAPTPAPAPMQPAPVPAPVRPNASIVQPPRNPSGVLGVVSWVLIGITVLVSLIPFVGCAGWAMGCVVGLAVIIMGIVLLTRGRSGQGAMLILAGVLLVPICIAVQFLSLAVFGGTADRRQRTQIIENLKMIDSAKVQWVSDTKASNGAPVTMANLTKQMNGKTISPTMMGETYDPMPVGQPPTATLPSNATLGKFKGGDTLTVASLEASLATGSFFDYLHSSKSSPTPVPLLAPASSPKPSAAPSVSASPSVAASPKPSAAPSVSASPRPSVSPRSTSGPKSLISPRQTVEPRDSPSSGPSPSAKFAPRVNPRQSPSSEDQPESDNSSGAPRQGHQRPRDSQSPSETPEEKPDDDDSDE